MGDENAGIMRFASAEGDIGCVSTFPENGLTSAFKVLIHLASSVVEVHSCFQRLAVSKSHLCTRRSLPSTVAFFSLFLPSVAFLIFFVSAVNVSPEASAQ